MKRSPVLIGAIATVLWFPFLSAIQKDEKTLQQQQQEESEDYFSKWLDEDVLYIISEEEREVFERLMTPEEKEQFIEQFWYRRDPDLGSSINEFKEEHYRRIAYSNENFPSGIAGWLTDRGRIYIIHGEPDEKESHPAGGNYNRPFHEGGGTTSTFPFEKWWYRNIEGLGDVELEFVDPSFSGEYRLAMAPWEKDALLHVPGAGLTLMEEMGMASKAQRQAFNPGVMSANQTNYFARAQDSPFRRYETYTFVQRPTQLKYKDLKEIVDINVTYNNLPFKIRPDYFSLNESQVLVPITLELQNKELTFQKNGELYSAKVGVYGVITSITNRIITEFEDDVMSSYRADRLDHGLEMRSIYQKILPLDRRMRYKLDLVVKDLNSGKVGVIRTAIVPPPHAKEKFTASSLILAEGIQPLRSAPKQNEMFVIGDVKVLPNLLKSFSQDKPLGVYLQVYNSALDQTTFSPSLRVSYQLLSDGKTVVEVVDETGESVQYYSGQRVVLIKALSTEHLEPGSYRLKVEVRDLINDQTVSVEDELTIAAGNQIAQR